MTREERNEYNRARHRTRRNKMIDYLGSECSRCGATDNLEFDHLKPDTKNFDISLKATHPWSLLLPELKKCQLLCRPCHKAKTREDFDQPNARETHGTLSSYRYCRCVECKAAKRTYMRRWRQKRDNDPLSHWLPMTTFYFVMIRSLVRIRHAAPS